MRHLLARATSLLLFCALLLPLEGCRSSLTPDEVFRSFILDPVPASVGHLQGHFVPRHEWGAWLHFTVSADDLAKIVAALDAQEDSHPFFERAFSSFADAPASLRPPKEWAGQCRMFSGLSSRGVGSSIIAKPETDEVFISLDQT